MPYKLSNKGRKLFGTPIIESQSVDTVIGWHDLTAMQRLAMQFAHQYNEPPFESKVFSAAEVASYYDYPTGQYFRGVLASLYEKGLLNKEDEV
jgi:hypothetical protein